MTQAVCSIPSSDDVYSFFLDQPIVSFADVIAHLNKLKKVPDHARVEEEIDKIITFVNANRGPFKHLLNRQLVISGIAGFNFPQFPESLQKKVNDFFLTIRV